MALSEVLVGQDMKRPVSVTILILLVLTIGGLNLIRFVQSLTQRSLLVELLPISPLYLTATGLFWCVLCGIVLWGIFRRKSWVKIVALSSAFLYVTYFWVDRIWLTQQGSRTGNDIFAVLMSIIMLGFTLWVFSTSRVKVYFGVSDDRRSKNY